LNGAPESLPGRGFLSAGG